MCRFRFIALLLTFAMLLSVTASADDWSDCSGSRPDRSIGACTRIIQSGGGYIGVPTAIRTGDRGPNIEALQSYLVSRGYNVGTIDRVYGPATEQAVRRANRELGADFRDLMLRGIRQTKLAYALNNRCNAYRDNGDYDRAIADCDQAIQFRPDLAEAHNNLGNGYVGKGDYGRAMAGYDRAIRLRPDYAEAYYNRGRAYDAKGDYDRATADCDQAIRLRLEFAEVYYNRGRTFHAKGDYDHAIADYSQAIRLRPDLAEAHNNRGLTFHAKGDYDRALADYGQAIRLKPDYAEPYYNRGLAFDQKGDPATARENFRVAARLMSPGNPWMNRALERIASIERKLATQAAQPPPLVTPKRSSTSTTTEKPTAPAVFTGGGIKVTASKRSIAGREVPFIAVEGQIRPGDDIYFKQALLTVSNPVVVVSFDSLGGDLRAGMEIGRTIWDHQYRTVVEHGICASACALAWLAGRPRYAAAEARIGFHAPTRIDDSDRKPDSVGSAFVGGYLTEIGFTAPAIAFMTVRDPGDMNWLTSTEAQSLGIYVEGWTE